MVQTGDIGNTFPAVMEGQALALSSRLGKGPEISASFAQLRKGHWRM